MAATRRLAGEPPSPFFLNPGEASPQGSPEERAMALDYPEHERSYALFTWLVRWFGAAWLILVFALIALYTT